jgi:PilZ domain
MEPERRGATRYNFGAIAEVVDLDGRGEVVSLTRDLSFSGVFVKTTTPLSPGTRVRVRITHSGEDFKAIGEVTGNITATGMGIVFTDIEPNDQAVLANWLGQGAQE